MSSGKMKSSIEDDFSLYLKNFQKHLRVSHQKILKASSDAVFFKEHLDCAHEKIKKLKSENENLKKESTDFFIKFKSMEQRAVRAERCLLKSTFWSRFYMDQAVKEMEENRRQREEAAFGPFGYQRSARGQFEKEDNHKEKEENDILKCIELLFINKL